MEKYTELIKHIQDSNLSSEDKSTLIDILSADTVDLNKFVETFISLLKLGSIALRLFGADIGDDLIE